MNLPRGWALLLLAAAALAAAVYAGSNQGIATLLAALALLAIGLLLLAPVRTVAVDRRPDAPAGPPEPASTFRAALEAGRSGRSEVVAQLDLVERRTCTPRPADHARDGTLPSSGPQPVGVSGGTSAAGSMRSKGRTGERRRRREPPALASGVPSPPECGDRSVRRRDLRPQPRADLARVSAVDRTGVGGLVRAPQCSARAGRRSGGRLGSVGRDLGEPHSRTPGSAGVAGGLFPRPTRCSAARTAADGDRRGPPPHDAHLGRTGPDRHGRPCSGGDLEGPARTRGAGGPAHARRPRRGTLPAGAPPRGRGPPASHPRPTRGDPVPCDR